MFGATSFEAKRTMTVASFSMRMFIMGIEFAVVFPSVWLYLKIFHVDYWYLGLVLSAYNTVGIVSTILVGRLADATRKIRFTGFLWNLAEIAGNIIYALHFHVACPLIGRMVAGFGEGFVSAMWGELARITTKEQRTRYFAILKGSNLLGAAIGPALNLFLKEFNFKIGKWRIDFRTSPGFFMGILWVFATLIMLVFVYDLSSEMQGEAQYELLSDKETISPTHSPKNEELKQHETDHGGRLDDTETPDENEKNGDEIKSTFKSALLDMITKSQVMVIVYLLFFISVFHTCLQGVTPLVAEYMLNWNETNVTIVYTVWGMEIIVVLLIVWMVSPKVEDRVILFVGVVFANLASISLLVLSYSKPESNLCFYSLLCTISLMGVGIGITVVIGRSLVSKHIRAENQGLVHAILTASNRLASLSGPILGSSLYTHKTVMAFFIFATQLLGLILIIATFKKLSVPQNEKHQKS